MSKYPIETIRHSLAHVMAYAVKEIYPDVKFGIGPVIENGFYYDFKSDHKFSEEDFAEIERRMLKAIESNIEIEHLYLPIEEAINEFSVQGQKYKLEILKEIESGERKAVDEEDAEQHKDGKISFYKINHFTDLCKGPHVKSTSDLPKDSFKILSVAGAYWRGSEKNDQLQRLYAVAFETKAELESHLNMLEEAKKRDHRKIGKDQELFFIDEVVGKGLAMWLPNGTIIRNEIEKLAVETENKYGYQRVHTPHMAKEELFLTSGHLPYYKDGMYPAMKMDDGTYYLKAMNCPMHHIMYNHRPKSYRDLPVRLAEYGTVYRNELSGTLAGLLRVRGMAMNDAHIYCRKDQIKDEFKSVMKMTMEYFEIFGLKDFWFRLSKWSKDHPEKYINEPESWEYTQAILKEVLEEMNVPFKEVEDEAAFYGPKVDVQFKSVIGREESMSTIQLDFLAKERFGLSYIDSDGKENKEVFVIHRAPLSTHERFLAFLIEHYAGDFPAWLAPTQIAVLSISDKQKDFVDNLVSDLLKKGLRVEAYTHNDSLGKKIRAAEMKKIPYIFVVGDKEKESQSVSVRSRKDGDLGVNKIESITDKILEEVKTKSQ